MYMRRYKEVTENIRVSLKPKSCISQYAYHHLQGTWIPLPEGRFFAEKYQVYEQLKAIFEFVPGDKSPPPAPKHTTAASNKPKNPKAAPVKRVSSKFRSIMSLRGSC